MTDLKALRPALVAALSVALHEEADPNCSGKPPYDQTQRRAEAVADTVLRMPALSTNTGSEPSVDRVLLEGAAVLEAIRELHREAGRMSRVSPVDVAVIVAAAHNLSDDALKAVVAESVR